MEILNISNNEKHIKLDLESGCLDDLQRHLRLTPVDKHLFKA